LKSALLCSSYCRAPLSAASYQSAPNGAYKENENSLALVVVGYLDLIPHLVKSMVAYNYLFCGFDLLGRLAEARFKVADDPVN
jgi:hypothetical protein